MACPMIIKDTLSKESTEDVQQFISSIINQSGSCDDGNNPNFGHTQLPNLGGKYKVCVIQNGKLEIPDEEISNALKTRLECSDGSSFVGCHDNDPENSCMETEFDPSNPLGKLSNKCETADYSKQEATSQNDKPKESDFDIFAKLLDHYRTFNEQQLGLYYQPNLPTYSRTKKRFDPIICEGMIKEAIQRVNKKRDEGYIMKEPTITEEEKKELFDDYAMYASIPPEDVQELFHDISLQTAMSFDNYCDIVRVGDNKLERTLENEIDGTHMEQNKKWEKNQVVELAHDI